MEPLAALTGQIKFIDILLANGFNIDAVDKVHVTKQILWVNGMRYDLQEAYGIANSVSGVNSDHNGPATWRSQQRHVVVLVVYAAKIVIIVAIFMWEMRMFSLGRKNMQQTRADALHSAGLSSPLSPALRGSSTLGLISV
nr:hypothetical protein [Tanacetum cinerariifolium]